MLKKLIADSFGALGAGLWLWLRGRSLGIGWPRPREERTPKRATRSQQSPAGN